MGLQTPTSLRDDAQPTAGPTTPDSGVIELTKKPTAGPTTPDSGVIELTKKPIETEAARVQASLISAETTPSISFRQAALRRAGALTSKLIQRWLQERDRRRTLQREITIQRKAAEFHRLRTKDLEARLTAAESAIAVLRMELTSWRTTGESQ